MPLHKLSEDRILSGSNAVAVAQLFTTEALSTTVKTLENRIARARDRLRRTLQRWAPT